MKRKQDCTKNCLVTDKKQSLAKPKSPSSDPFTELELPPPGSRNVAAVLKSYDELLTKEENSVLGKGEKADDFIKELEDGNVNSWEEELKFLEKNAIFAEINNENLHYSSVARDLLDMTDFDIVKLISSAADVGESDFIAVNDGIDVF